MPTITPVADTVDVQDPQSHIAVLREAFDRRASAVADLDALSTVDRVAKADGRSWERVIDRHQRYDRLAEVVDGRDVSHRRAHLSPLTDVTEAVRWRLTELVAPRLRIFGTSDYTVGWTWASDQRFQATTDLLQDVLEQQATFDLPTGAVHLRHRLSNHRSELKSLIGFPYRPGLAVGYADIRPYFRYSVGGYVDALDTAHWPGGTADRCRSYTFGQVYLTSTAADGTDARAEGPVQVRSSYHPAVQGSSEGFRTDGVLTVGDGLRLEALVISSRSYYVWVGAYAWAWSQIVPRLATSQVLAVEDASVPFVVVEERPIA